MSNKNKSKEEVISKVIETEQYTNDEKQFVEKFVNSYFSFLGNDHVTAQLKNKIIKDMNMNPLFKDRDTVEKMIASPKDYEQPLRQVSQHLQNVVMPIKRLIAYYASILEWDYTIIPIEDFKTMKTTAFKKAETRVYDWLDALKPKKSFKRLLKGALVEDAKFYYYRESNNGVSLQEMPSDYCMITYEDEFSYRYAFDMNYFLKSGVDIDGFAPEFRQYYNEVFITDEQAKYRRNNWIELNPEKAFVFKFDMLRAGLTPPLIGLFVDATEIDTYRNLQKSKTALEAYKLIMGTIPRHKDNKSGNKKDDLALSAEMSAKFAGIIKNSMPEGVDFKVTPFDEHQVFEFESQANKADVSGNALKNLINNSGSSQIMSMEKPSQSTVKTAEKIDESFVKDMYLQAEDFVNFYLQRIISPKYKFRIKFEGTIFDKESREESAKNWAALGIITDKIGASMGLNPREFDKMLEYMKSRGYPDKFEPIESAYQSGKGDNGRPQKSDSDISDSGATSKDNDTSK